MKSRLFSKGQAKAVLKKLKDVWGDVRTWSKARLIELGKFAKNLDIEDIKKIDIEKMKVYMFLICHYIILINNKVLYSMFSLFSLKISNIKFPVLYFYTLPFTYKNVNNRGPLPSIITFPYEIMEFK